MDTVEVIVPIYKAVLDPFEQFSLDHSLPILSCYPLTFIAPLGLNVSYYANRYGGKFLLFPPEYFQSVNGYSRLLVSRAFYQMFEPSSYILILQSDAYVFRDDLPYWLSRGVDYVGAPWPNGIDLNIQAGIFASTGGKTVRTYVGNGGFSLRNVTACIRLIEEHAEIANWFIQSGSNEDLFFSIMGGLSQDFLIPNQIMASRFAVETQPEHYYALNSQRLPMGVHGYRKHNPEFWRSYIPF